MPKYYWDDSTRLTNIFVSKAKGSILTDVDGSEYIDLTSQWATNNLGHVNPEVLEATVKALEQYGFLIYGMNPTFR
jgi:4-aminobutyrate aminotransferase-like enzyme